MGHTKAQAVNCWPVTAGDEANPRPGHVVFVGDKVAVGQVFL